MTNKPNSKAKQDWLEPPEWWKKWKPLRWIAGGVVVISVASLLRNYFADETPGGEALHHTEAPVEHVVLESQPLTAATPEPAPPDEIAPTPGTATPGPQPQPPAPTPKPVPAPVQPAPAAPASAPASGDIAAYTFVETERAVFLDPFLSYESLARVTGILKQQGIEAEVKSNHVAVPDDVPPYQIDRIDIAGFTHLGETGKLSLSLFNDRLYELEFEPDDPESYLAKMRPLIPQLKTRGQGRVEISAGPLRILSTMDLALSDVGRALRTRPYILWQDTRLIRQRDEWDQKYAKEAVR